MGTAIEVSAKLPANEDRPQELEGTVLYDFGDNIDEAIEKFGGDTVFSGFVANSKVTLQSGVRRCLENGRDPQAFADVWKPGVKAPSIAQDPMAAARSAFARMTDEEKAEFLQQLKG